MHLSRTTKSFFALTLLALVLGLVLGQRGVSAQMDESHPAHIHSGSCAQLGDVVYPLSNVSASALVGGTPVAGTAVGAADAIPVQISGTTVPATLASLLESPHAINIHESAENIGNYIACGNIGGTMVGPSDLAIGLGELNESGYSGIATLHDNGDGTTAVSVYLTEYYAAMGETMGTPTSGMGAMEMGTPASDAGQTTQTASGMQVAVSIENFAYDPTPVAIKVGDTVTWTNNDTVPHTVTANDGSFQSGTLQSGQTFSFTFTTTGTIDYHCEFHPNMHGQVVVH